MIRVPDSRSCRNCLSSAGPTLAPTDATKYAHRISRPAAGSCTATAVSSTAGLRDEAEKMNAKLSDLIALLRSGEAKVQVVKPDKDEKPEKGEPAMKLEKAGAADKPEKTEGEKDGSQ